MRETLRGADRQPLLPTPANVKFATRMATDIRRRIGAGTFVWTDFFPDSPRFGSGSSFESAADNWLQSQGRLAPATRAQYASAVRFWKRMFGGMAIRDITQKVAAGRIGSYMWPSATTHNNYMIALRGIFGLEEGQSPVAKIENMAVVKRLPDPLTANERDVILAGMRRYDQRIGAYFAFAFYTGMRPEEIIALRWADIDWRHGTARVQRVRTFKGHERDGSKTHTERDVDLVDQALVSLKAMKEYTFLKHGADGDIFENPVTGQPWHDERGQRETYWQPTLKRCGIRARRAYATRHTFATVLLMAGVPPAYIAAQLGNSVQMLLSKYARWIGGADGGNARALAQKAMERAA